MLEHSAMPSKDTELGVGINIQVPVMLHRQARLRAMAMGLTLGQGVVSALEAWVAPGEREAQLVRQVLAIFDQPGGRAEVRARIAAIGTPAAEVQ